MANVVQIGTIRMVVHSITPAKGGREQMKAFCKMVDPHAPFVSIAVTITVPIDCHLAYRAGDEFDLPFPLTAIKT